MSTAQKQANTNDVESGKRLSQKQIILQLLKDGLPMTRKQVKSLTNFQTETISGRLSDLAKEGLVLETPVGTETYYSPIYAKELTGEIKKRKSEEKTKRVLKALINDVGAMDVLVNECFNHDFLNRIISIKLSEEIIKELKKHIK